LAGALKILLISSKGGALLYLRRRLVRWVDEVTVPRDVSYNSEGVGHGTAIIQVDLSLPIAQRILDQQEGRVLRFHTPRHCHQKQSS